MSWVEPSMNVVWEENKRKILTQIGRELLIKTEVNMLIFVILKRRRVWHLRRPLHLLSFHRRVCQLGIALFRNAQDQPQPN